jgi:hypothetical protein
VTLFGSDYRLLGLARGLPPRDRVAGRGTA